MIIWMSRQEIERAIRLLLAAVILFNAFAGGAATVHAELESGGNTVPAIQGRTRAIHSFPTFERPQSRISDCIQTPDFAEARATEHLAGNLSADSGSAAISSCPTGLLLLGYEGYESGFPYSARVTDEASATCVPASESTIYCFGSYSGHNLPGPSMSYYEHKISFSVGANYRTVYFDVMLSSFGDGVHTGINTQGFGSDINTGSFSKVIKDEPTTGTSQLIFNVWTAGDGMPDPYPQVSYTWKVRISFGLACLYQTPAVQELTTLSSCSGDACISAEGGTQANVGAPINSRTGNYEYYSTDISIPTSAGDLRFTRDYVSATTTLATTLSPGWTHSLDTRLIFPTEPEGQPDTVLFKAHTANRYFFHINSFGERFTPYPGLNASLRQNQGTPPTYTLTDSQQNSYLFDENGKLLTFTDPLGHAWDYLYTSDGKLDRVNADGGSEYLDLHYNAQGKLQSVSDHTGRSVSYSYDANDDLNSFTDLLGQNWTYEYQPTSSHLLTRVAAPGDVTVERQEYYPDGQAWKQYDGEDNLIVELSYDDGGLTTIKDALGNTDVHLYDGRGTLISEVNELGIDLEKQYDDHFRPSLITDRAGSPTHLTWSPNGANLTAVKDALQNQTHIVYNAANKPARVIDPLQHETKYFYTDTDFPTLPTRVEYPLSFDGGSTYAGIDYEYYPPSSGAFAGQVKFETDALGHKTYYTYTPAGQTESITNAYGTPNALTTTYAYDSLGRLTEVTDAQDVLTHNEYDAAGRLRKTIRNYDPGRPQNDENQYNLVTEYRYDLRGNQIAVIDTYDTITRTYYDRANRPVTIVQNLVGQTIQAATPPDRGTGAADENVRTDMRYDKAGNTIATIDPKGIVTRVYYDEANRPIVTVQNLTGQEISVKTPPTHNPAFPDQNVRTDAVYDDNGNVIAIIDTNGVITRTYYDAVNRPVAVVRNLTGQAISVETLPARGVSSNVRTDTVYDANGNPIATVDPKGIITRTYFDALNRPASVVQNLVGQAIGDPNPPAAGRADTNIRTDTYYDEAGNAIATVDPRGVVTRIYYDSASRPYATVQNLVVQDIYEATPPARASGEADQNIRSDTVYDSAGRPEFTTNPLGRVAKYEYNILGQVTGITANYVNGAPQNEENQRNIISLFTYDALGRKTSVTDSNHHTTSYSYDALSRVTAMEDALGHITQTQYDKLGNITKRIDPLLRETSYQYDSLSRVISQTDPLEGLTSYKYDGMGNLLAFTDPNGHETTTVYDELYRAVQVFDANDHVTTRTYDGNGNLTAETNALNERITYRYDNLNRRTQVEDALGNVTGFTFDAAGNQTAMIDANGAQTQYGYDASDRLKTVVENYQLSGPTDQETNVSTEYAYDKNGNRLSIRDGNQHTTNFLYDELNRLIRETDPLNHFTQYGYDPVGNRTQVTDANGNTITYAYDDANQLTSILYPDQTVTFTYDNVGQRTDMYDAAGHTHWDYDALGRATSITDPFNATVGYAYDAVGNRASLTYPGGSVVHYTYDNASRLTMVNGASTIVNYIYDDADRVTNVTRSNGVQTHYSYDPMGRIQSILHQTGSEVLSSYAYTLDNVGNRIQAVERVAAPFGPPPTSAPSQTASPTFPSTETETVTPVQTETDIVTTTVAPTETPTASATDSPMTGGNQDKQGKFVLANYPLAPNTKIPKPSLTPTKTPTASKTFTPNGPTSTATTTNTPATSNTPSPTGTSTSTADPNVINTGWKSPATYTALPWGDGDGFEVNPTQAFADDGLFALDNNSGTGTKNDCTDWSNYDTTNFQTFNFNIPAGATIRGVEVRIDAKVDDASSNARMCVWDHPSSLLQTAENTYIMGGPNDRWGMTWTASDFSNSDFYLEIADAAQSRLRDFSLDYVAVKVYYVAPATKTPTATKTSTPSVTPSPTPTPTNTATPSITPSTTRTPHNTSTPINVPTFSDATATATRQPTSAPTDLPTPLPGYTETTITYHYDPLYRLTTADYSSGAYYHYAYDAVGNRLSQETGLGITNYVYDDANRLSSVNGISYTWDNNGNLLNDGVNAYTYDSANRLTALSNQQSAVSYVYNGLGDRVSQTVDGNTTNFSMDVNSRLTQVLNDGTRDYIYGLSRIAQSQGGTTEYFLGDALGSVRQLTDQNGSITYTSAFDPFGASTFSNGSSQTPYGFTGEYTDTSGLIYLRARYYESQMGRFTSKDTFEGDLRVPASLNRFNYAHSNPVMNTDPSGHCIFAGVDTVLCAAIVGGAAGAVIGGAYAKWMYHLAYTGKCGCEGQQLISQYTEAQFVWKGIGMGAVFGAAFSALTVASAGGAVVAALGGIGLSGYGIATSVQRIQVDPNNECAWWDLGLSIFGLAMSGYSIGKVLGEVGPSMGGSAPLKYGLSEFSKLLSRIPKDKPVVVIGEGMSRVNPVAEALKGEGFDVITYEPRAFRSTPGQLSRLDLEANRSWLSYWVKERGATVIDIGLQNGRPEPSPFYALEFRSIYQNWKYPNVLHYSVP